jgi:hypothetical protein
VLSALYSTAWSREFFVLIFLGSYKPEQTSINSCSNSHLTFFAHHLSTLFPVSSNLYHFSLEPSPLSTLSPVSSTSTNIYHFLLEPSPNTRPSSLINAPLCLLPRLFTATLNHYPHDTLYHLEHPLRFQIVG